MKEYARIAGSSNGRTSGFGPEYRGSTPCPAATMDKSKKLLLNRNEIIQGPAPECLNVLKNFDPKHASFYFDGYFGSVLQPKLSEIFSLPKERILVGYGIEYFLRIIFDSLRADKDTVVTHELHYTFYSTYLNFKKVRLAQFKLVELADTFEFDVGDCLDKIRGTNPKVVLITSPNNPTGHSIKVDDLSKILTEASKDTLVVLDEAYYGFDDEHDEKGFLSLLESYDNLLILRSFSKLYALAGMRIGFGLCGKRVKEILGYQDSYLGGSRVLEEVALAALNAKDYYRKLSSEIIADRGYFIEAVSSLKNFKAFASKANFVFVNVDPEVKSKFEGALESQDFLISKFMNASYMRVTIGSNLHTKRFLKLLSEF